VFAPLTLLQRCLAWFGGRKPRDTWLWHLYWTQLIRREWHRPGGAERVKETLPYVLAGFAELPNAERLIPAPRRPSDDAPSVLLIQADVGQPAEVCSSPGGPEIPDDQEESWDDGSDGSNSTSENE
jgi:hypothetical protein